MGIRAAVVTVSDKGFAGERADASGPLLAELLQGIGVDVVAQTIVPDDSTQIQQTLAHLADDLELDLVPVSYTHLTLPTIYSV